MNIDSLKLELIHWILCLQDVRVLTNIQKIKDKNGEGSNGKLSSDLQPRQFGCGRGIFTYVADDFDDIPPGFEDYLLS